MRQCSCRCEALCLTAGEPYAIVSDNGFRTVFHGQYFILQRGCRQIRHCVLLAATKYIIQYRIGAELWVMTQITNCLSNFA